MKKTVFAALIIAGFVFAACDKNDDSEPQPNSLDGTLFDTTSINLEALTEYYDGDFAFNIVKQLNTSAKGNFLLSPVSVELAFAMLANGADGNSRQQILDAFGYGSKSIDDLNNRCRSVISEWYKLNSKYASQSEELSQYGGSQQPQTIETANAIWTDSRAPLFQEYIDLSNRYFDAEAATLNFADKESSLATMNGWCNQKTHGMIPEMLKENDITDNTISVLANSIYFKADWRRQFEKNATIKADFTSANGEVSQVDMMRQQEYFGYVSTENFAMAELPYNGTTCMDIILPNSGISVGQCVSQLSQPSFDAALAKMSSEELFVCLPKFDLEFKHQLIDILNQLGIVDVFDSNKADLSKMGSSHDKAFVSKAFQLSHISVEESGTEAAAVTVIVVDKNCVVPGEASPIEFNVNRPFAYVIRDKQTGTILFVGKVEDFSTYQKTSS